MSRLSKLALCSTSRPSTGEVEMLILGMSFVMFCFSLGMLVVEAFDPLPLLIDTDGDLFRLIDKRPLEGFVPETLESEGSRSRGWLPFGFVALASFCKKVGAMTRN